MRANNKIEALAEKLGYEFYEYWINRYALRRKTQDCSHKTCEHRNGISFEVADLISRVKKLESQLKKKTIKRRTK